jgi:hypothetical protein
MGRRLRELAKLEIEAANAAHDPIPYRTRYALLSLANELRDKPGEIWTSDENIAAKVGMTPTAYYQARTELMRRGIVTRVRGGGQGSRFNRYRLVQSSRVSTELTSSETTELDGIDHEASSRETMTTSRETEMASSETQTSSRETADISPTNPYEPIENPAPYGAAAPPTQHRNRPDPITEITQPIPSAAVINEDIETERQRQLTALTEMAHAPG